MSADDLSVPPSDYPQPSGPPQYSESYPQQYPEPYPQTYPEPYPQAFTVQYQGQGDGMQPQPYPTQGGVNPDPMTYPTQPYQPPPPTYSTEKPQPTAVQVVVQEQPRAVVVHQTTNYGQGYFGFSIACVILSSVCFWPSLLFAIPALICSVMSQGSYSRGDDENGARQGKWSVGLNIAAILTFIAYIIFIIIIIIIASVV
ncbi:uncharacterized protein [Dysidea avara]|uniref:uncharacterized protein n=1 Tax=Dysidea avara TaxID=196820 RepID=UPI003320146D